MANKIKTNAAVVVTTAGTRVRLSATDLAVSTFAVLAPTTNIGDIYFGDETVTSANGVILEPGDILRADGGSAREVNLKEVWIDAATSGDQVRVSYLTIER